MNYSTKHRQNEKMEVGVLEYVDDSGNTIYYERYEGLLALADFDHGKKYKLACRGCPRYGKNLSCPPYSPTFRQYADRTKFAKVICLRFPMGSFAHLLVEERYRSCFRQARSLLVDELLEYRSRGHIVAGCGACFACEQCGAEICEEDCKLPDKRIYSLESLGVNVTSLVKRCFELDFEWTVEEHAADFVCAVGAVLS